MQQQEHYNEMELENDKLLNSLKIVTESREKYKREYERVLKECDELKQEYEESRKDLFVIQKRKKSNKDATTISTSTSTSISEMETLRMDLSIALDRIDELRLELNHVKVQRDQLKCEIERVQLELEYYQDKQEGVGVEVGDLGVEGEGLQQELLEIENDHHHNQHHHFFLNSTPIDDTLPLPLTKGFSLLDEVESEKLKLLQMNSELQQKYKKVLQLYKQSEQKCKRLRQELMLNSNTTATNEEDRDGLVKSLQLDNIKLIEELGILRLKKDLSFTSATSASINDSNLLFTDGLQKLKRELTLVQRQRSLEMEKCHQLETLLMQQEKKYQEEMRERLRLQCLLDEERIKQKIDTLEKDVLESGGGGGGGVKIEAAVEVEEEDAENEDFNKCNQQ